MSANGNTPEPADWAPGWAEKIAEAQDITHVTFFKVPFARIAYGPDHPHITVKPRCYDCGVLEGQLHVQGCCVEQCPICLGQAMWCGCPDDFGPDDEGDDGDDGGDPVPSGGSEVTA
ncbi:hypothetical protein J2X90_005586 [Variovorax paradoxus]|uniref:hypothetical protein n=1 Tax=Variovorax paradoxus TaxID=34073 RepID=UPI002783324B|nr:hypothetical protein [Variovorax paradoxus]MDQ0027750.1 hypothetical protein [Variovorax paradoxus]